MSSTEKMAAALAAVDAARARLYAAEAKFGAARAEYKAAADVAAAHCAHKEAIRAVLRPSKKVILESAVLDGKIVTESDVVIARNAESLASRRANRLHTITYDAERDLEAAQAALDEARMAVDALAEMPPAPVEDADLAATRVALADAEVCAAAEVEAATSISAPADTEVAAETAARFSALIGRPVSEFIECPTEREDGLSVFWFWPTDMEDKEHAVGFAKVAPCYTVFEGGGGVIALGVELREMTELCVQRLTSSNAPKDDAADAGPDIADVTPEVSTEVPAASPARHSATTKRSEKPRPAVWRGGCNLESRTRGTPADAITTAIVGHCAPGTPAAWHRILSARWLDDGRVDAARGEVLMPEGYTAGVEVWRSEAGGSWESAWIGRRGGLFSGRAR